MASPHERASPSEVTRLLGNTEIRWEVQSHFFAVAARAMRNVLADHERVTLSGLDGDGIERVFSALDVGDELEEMATWNERLARAWLYGRLGTGDLE